MSQGAGDKEQGSKGAREQGSVLLCTLAPLHPHTLAPQYPSSLASTQEGDVADGTILWQVREGTAWVILKRPERRNALNRPMMEELAAALERANADPQVRVVVLTGAGEAFCAGGDLADFLDRSPAEQRQAVQAFARLMAILPTLGKPVIAAVNGLALGGGCGLVAACDLAIAAETARFGLPELRVGLFPFLVMPHLLRTIGRRAFLKLALTGELIDAHEAKRPGLVDRVMPSDRLREEVSSLANQIQGHSPTLLHLGKEALRRVGAQELPAARETLQEILLTALATADAQEGMRAFVEKRASRWET